VLFMMFGPNRPNLFHQLIFASIDIVEYRPCQVGI
jgi:hypothetical protein